MPEISKYEIRRNELRQQYLPDSTPPADLPWTGGVDHLALICSDIEATIRFYTEVLQMRLSRIVQNRDEPTSTHIFLDMGGGNLLAFFDFPELGDSPTTRGIGSMHHVAIKADPEQYRAILEALKTKQITYSLHGTEEAGSVYFLDPDGIKIEIKSVS
jgi:catechol 2,3-dioxygenase-like lactoylglutathione lyase family enzyme